MHVEIKKRLDSEFVGVVKNNHAKFPKAYLVEKMERWPSGLHLVLEAEYEGVQLLAIGYKYNSSKTQLFVTTKSAGATTEGVSYKAKWKDTHGNTHRQYIPRPAVIATYYGCCNVINVCNEARQSEMHLEKYWVTEDRLL